MTFWLLAAGLLAASIALVALPALRRGGAAPEDAARQDQLRRLGELEGDIAAGEIDASASAAVRRELERNLIENVASAEGRRAAARRAPRSAILAVCLLVPLLASVVYLHTGSPRIAEFAANHRGIDLASPAATVELLLAELRQRVRAVPEDRDAWALLARTYLQLGRFELATEAAEATYRLAPGDPGAILVLVDALAMRQGGRIDGRAEDLLDELLALDGDHTTALVLKGIVAQQAGESGAAHDWWQRALAGLAPDSPLRGDLERMLGPAAGDVATADPARGAGAGAVSVRVDVSLAPELAGRARPDDTVFVFARAVDGPPMPLAVSRHRGAELPLSVTLDDSMGMTPGATLADFPEVYLVARVSRAGGATAASGDLEGRSKAFTPGGDAAATITIDRVLP